MDKIEILKLLADHKLSKAEAKELLSQTAEVTAGMDSRLGADRSNINEKVTEILSNLLHIDREEITDTASLKSLGIDSINGIEILRDINREFGLNIETSAIYDHPVFSEFITFLAYEAGKLNSFSKETEIRIPVQVNNTDLKDADTDQENAEGIWEGVCRIIRDYLHLGPEDIDRESLFKDLGIDSINGVELIREINRNYRTNLETSSIYDYPRVLEFVNYLSGEVTHGRELFNQVIHQEEFRTNNKKLSMAVNTANTALEESLTRPKLTEQKLTLKKETPSQEPIAIRTAEPRPVSKLALKAKTNITEEVHRTLSIEKEDFPVKKTYQAEVIDTDIAIIGISGKFPKSDSIEELWENITQRKDCMTEIPKERWDWRDYYSEDAQDIHKTYCNRGGFIDSISEFDSLFFNISPAEADLMDPQHRLVLEETWKCVEDAGYSRSSLNGRNCGVYIAAAHGDYNSILAQKGLSNNLYSFNGLNVFTLSGYISHVFDLHGPNLTLDCACSSSLVAIHEACQSIRSGETNLVIAGGVRAMLTPDLLIRTGNLEMLSKKGVYKCYDKEADGMLLSEGVGIVLLKNLKQAKEDGDHIYGVIKGSYVNHNGRTNCISSLNEEAQYDLLSRAFEKYNINPEDISYVEGNGCGSLTGEELELKALKNVFKNYTKKKQFCALGSVKAAIGHSTMASGIAGIFHILMGFKHNRYPVIATLETENDALGLSDSPFYLSKENTPWLREEGKKRMACVSAFGAGGTNAFLILEEGEEIYRESPKGEFYLFPISARVKISLRKRAEDLREWLINESEDIPLRNISYTLIEGREHFKERYCYIADSKQTLIREIETSLQEDMSCLTKAGETLHKNTAKAYESGSDLKWSELYSPVQREQRVSLPVYPFLRKKAWVDSSIQEERTGHKEKTFDNNQSLLHPFIHTNVSSLDKYRFKTLFVQESFFFKDHQINNRKVFPGVAYLEMARAAASLLSEQEIFELHDVYWTNAMVIEDTLQVYTDIKPLEKELYYTISSETGGRTAVHNRGYISFIKETAGPSDLLNINEIKNRLRQSVTGEDYYRKYANKGLYLGNSFRTIKEIYLSDLESLSIVKLASDLTDTYVLNPSIMDAMVETVIGLVDNLTNSEAAQMPYSLEKFSIYRPLDKECFIYAKVTDTKEKVKCRVIMTDRKGEPILTMEGLTLMSSDSEAAETLQTEQRQKEIKLTGPEPKEQAVQKESSEMDAEEVEILKLLTMLKENKISVSEAEYAFGGGSQ